MTVMYLTLLICTCIQWEAPNLVVNIKWVIFWLFSIKNEKKIFFKGKKTWTSPFKLSHPVLNFLDYIPIGRNTSLRLNKLYSPLSIWLKLVQWFLRKCLKDATKVLKFFSMSKAVWLLFWATCNLNPILPIKYRVALWFWRKSWKCKSLRTHGRTKSDQRCLSFQFKWPKMNFFC